MGLRELSPLLGAIVILALVIGVRIKRRHKKDCCK